MLRVISRAGGQLWRQPAASLSTSRPDRLSEGDCARVTRVITRDDVKKYGDLVGDLNPVHEEIVHSSDQSLGHSSDQSLSQVCVALSPPQHCGGGGGAGPSEEDHHGSLHPPGQRLTEGLGDGGGRLLSQ